MITQQKQASPSTRASRRILRGTAIVILAAAGIVLAFRFGNNSGNNSPVVPVSKFGAVGDGRADDSAAIQNTVNASKDGNRIDFADGKTYRITRKLELRPNRQYSGKSTIMMDPAAAPGTVMGEFVNGQSDNITVTDLTFDANHVSGGLQLAVRGGARGPAKKVTIDGCTFRNTKSGQLWEAAIYNPSGLVASTIRNNHFHNCGLGVFLADPNKVQIEGNDFDGILDGNAITVALYPASFAYGHDLIISGNTGRNLSRSAIAIWGGAPGVTMEHPIIRGNRFEAWGKTAKNTAGFSIVAGEKAEIADNWIAGSVSIPAIEIGSPGSSVSGNTVNGFSVGILVQGQPDVTIQNNKLIAQTDSGIQMSNVKNNLRLRVLDNTIVNSRNYGIGSLPNDYGGSVIRGNTITREIGFFPEDNDLNAKFIGIKLDSGLKSPVSVKDNHIVQSAVNPARKFDFWAIGLFGKQSGSFLENNVFESKSRNPLGTGFFFWYAKYADGASVRGNHFINLASVTNGYTSRDVKAHKNYQCKVPLTDPNLDMVSDCR